MENNENENDDYILEEIKIGELNKDKVVRERQTNFYKRIWSLNQKTRFFVDSHDKKTPNPIRYKKSLELLNESMVFKYMLGKKKLGYVPISDKFNQQNENNCQKLNDYDNKEYSLYEPDNITYNSMIRNDVETISPNTYGYYNKRDNIHPRQSVRGEFGIIRLNTNKDRNRTPINIKNSEKKNKKITKRGKTNHEILYDDDNNPEKIFRKKENLPNEEYTDIRHRADDEFYNETPHEYRYNNVHDQQSYYYKPSPDYKNNYSRYHHIDNDPKAEFKKCYDSWNNLYRSMTNAANYNDSAHFIYDHDENQHPKEDTEFVYSSAPFQNYQVEPICVHCNTKETSLWRRLAGHTVCNACGLYFKMHGVKRPSTLKKTNIKKRRRVAKRKTEHE